MSCYLEDSPAIWLSCKPYRHDWHACPLAIRNVLFCMAIIRYTISIQMPLFILSGDSLSHHKNRSFSTKDADHDISRGSCSSLYHGAWWYTHCYLSNLNGQYYLEDESGQHYRGVVWSTWKECVLLKTVTMKMRPAGFAPGEKLMQ